MSDKDKLLKKISEIGLERMVWVTDLDLTVLEAMPNPNEIITPEGLEDTFTELEEKTEGRFYIITGREMPYVEGLFPNRLFKASTEYHNMMRWETNGEALNVNPLPKWELIDEELDKIASEYEGLVLRKKIFMRTIHYSHAPALQDENEKQKVFDRLAVLLKRIESETGQMLENKDGGKVFDMGPKGYDKETAFGDIMDHANQNYNLGKRKLVPIYFGDSPGDLPAAKFVKENGGIFVAVGNDERVTSVADYVLSDPEDCRQLSRMASELPAKKNGLINSPANL